MSGFGGPGWQIASSLGWDTYGQPVRLAVAGHDGTGSDDAAVSDRHPG